MRQQQLKDNECILTNNSQEYQNQISRNRIEIKYSKRKINQQQEVLLMQQTQKNSLVDQIIMIEETIEASQSETKAYLKRIQNSPCQNHQSQIPNSKQSKQSNKNQQFYQNRYLLKLYNSLKYILILFLVSEQIKQINVSAYESVYLLDNGYNIQYLQMTSDYKIVYAFTQNNGIKIYNFIDSTLVLKQEIDTKLVIDYFNVDQVEIWNDGAKIFVVGYNSISYYVLVYTYDPINSIYKTGVSQYYNISMNTIYTIKSIQVNKKGDLLLVSVGSQQNSIRRYLYNGIIWSLSGLSIVHNYNSNSINRIQFAKQDTKLMIFDSANNKIYIWQLYEQVYWEVLSFSLTFNWTATTPARCKFSNDQKFISCAHSKHQYSNYYINLLNNTYLPVLKQPDNDSFATQSVYMDKNKVYTVLDVYGKKVLKYLFNLSSKAYTLIGQTAILKTPALIVSQSQSKFQLVYTTAYTPNNFSIFLLRNSCNNTMTNCVSCQIANTNKCIFCSQQYLLQNGTCLNCAPGYFKNGSICSTCSITFCKVCNSSTCSQCMTGYILSGNSCSSSCSISYYKLDSMCIKCPYQCFSCIDGNLTSCIACNNGYFNSSNKCINCVSNCFNCTNSSACITCNDGYYQSNNTCTSCMPTCLTCSNSLTCIQCKPGHSFNFGQCEFCEIGYYKNQGVCNPCVSNCHYCDTNTQCIKCLTGFYIQQGNCSSCLTNCDYCINSTSCINCTKGYQVNGSLCFTCSAGYFKDTDEKCKSCSVSNCKTCQKYLNCIECSNGYELFDNPFSYCALGFSNCRSCVVSLSKTEQNIFVSNMILIIVVPIVVICIIVLVILVKKGIIFQSLINYLFKSPKSSTTIQQQSVQEYIQKLKSQQQRIKDNKSNSVIQYLSENISQAPNPDSNLSSLQSLSSSRDSDSRLPSISNLFKFKLKKPRNRQSN